MKKETEIKIEKSFWVIARHGDPNGYHTGFANMTTSLFEFDSVTELNEFIGDKSVESGESMGDYIFNIKATSHSNEIRQELEEYEKLEEENAILENEYMGEVLE